MGQTMNFAAMQEVGTRALTWSLAMLYDAKVHSLHVLAKFRIVPICKEFQIGACTALWMLWFGPGTSLALP